MNKLRNNAQGFTIVELILALAFFSFVLLFSIAGFIQINRSYNKGLTVKRIHETGRLVIEDLARMVHSSNGEVTLIGSTPADTNPSQRRFCVGGFRVGWNNYNDTTREQFSGSGNFINLSRTQDGGSCSDPIPFSDSESYLEVPENAADARTVYGAVVVYNLYFSQIGTEAIRIDLTLASSDPEGDLLDTSDPDNITCKGSIIQGDQFCDVVQLATTVSLRT